MAPAIETLTYRDVAKTIDHSLLRPELDDRFVEAGCRLAAAYDVASVCVRPTDVLRARAILDGTDVAVGTVVGFPHGNHRTETKIIETRQALADGATAWRQACRAARSDDGCRSPGRRHPSSSFDSGDDVEGRQ